jgi:outer membrane protein OmpA-like peptidoglycan-associated protein
MSQMKNYKKIILSLILIFMGSNFSFAELMHGPEQALQEKPSKYGTVIIYRENDTNIMRSPVIFINDKVVGALLPNEYAQTDVCTGEIQLNIASRGSIVDSGLTKNINVAADKITYIKVTPNDKAFTMQIISWSKAKKHISSIKKISNVINRQLCIVPFTNVVLLDTNNSTHNAVVVSTKSGEALIDKPYLNSTLVGNKQKPTPPTQADPSAVRQKYAKELSMLPGKPISFLFYFENDTEIKKSSKKQINALKNIVLTRQPVAIDIIGHTDTTGNESQNYTLALERAKQTEQYLMSQGVQMSRKRVISYGEKDLIVQTPDDTPKKLNRCVEVVVR